MKYKLIRNDLEPSYPGKPFGWVPDDMKDCVETRKNASGKEIVYWKTGIEFEHPLGFRLVQNGDAVPTDDECREKAGLSPSQMENVAYSRERLAKGIHPEDFEAYDKGWMDGYSEDGSGKWKPGPNYAQWKATQDESEDEEEPAEEPAAKTEPTTVVTPAPSVQAAVAVPAVQETDKK